MATAQDVTPAVEESPVNEAGRVDGAVTNSLNHSLNLLPTATNGCPLLPGAVTKGVPTPRAVRVPTAKQLEALEANRKKRQAEAAVRRAEKLAAKASELAKSAEEKKEATAAVATATAAATADLVASIPISQAAKARKRTADIAEMPDALRRMESKFEARMQTVLDAMTKMQRAAAQTKPTAFPIPQRFFPRPTKGVLTLLGQQPPTDGRPFEPKMFRGSEGASSGNAKYYSDDDGTQVEVVRRRKTTPMVQRGRSVSFHGKLSEEHDGVTTDRPIPDSSGSTRATGGVIDLCSSEDEEEVDAESDVAVAANPF